MITCEHCGVALSENSRLYGAEINIERHVRFGGHREPVCFAELTLCEGCTNNLERRLREWLKGMRTEGRDRNDS